MNRIGDFKEMHKICRITQQAAADAGTVIDLHALYGPRIQDGLRRNLKVAKLFAAVPGIEKEKK